MKKSTIERNLVVLLFVAVLVTFSLAERDSKKIEKMYTASQLIKKSNQLLSETAAQYKNSGSRY